MGYLLPSLASILLLFAVIALLFTGRYPTGLYDFVLGINRWALRVRAYSGCCATSIRRFAWIWGRVNCSAREHRKALEPLNY